MKCFATAPLALFLLTATASAQTTPLLPPGSRVGILVPAGTGISPGQTHSTSNPELVETAMKALQEVLIGLRYEVLSPMEVLTGLIDANTQCGRDVHYCEPSQVLQALELDATIRLSVWTDEQPGVIRVSLTLPRATGQAEDQIIGDPTKLVPPLVSTALQDAASGQAVRVDIRALQGPAQVRVEGQVIGTTPLSHNFTVGTHSVTLEAPGFVTTSRRIEVSRGMETPVLVTFDLKRAPDAEPASEAMLIPFASEDPSDGEASSMNFVVGTASIALGVPLGVVSTIALAEDGQCRDDLGLDAACDRTNAEFPQVGMLIGGVLLTAVGIYFLVDAPIGASMSTDGDSVHVQINAPL